MKTRNILFLILALLVICGLMLISCNRPDDSDTDTETETDTDEELEDLEGYKITLDSDKKLTIKIQNYNNEPIVNAVVLFSRHDSSESMDMTGSDGTVQKTLKAGSTFITVESSVSKKNYYLVLSEEKDDTVVLNAYEELESSRVHDGGTPDSESITDDRVAYITRKEGVYYATGLKGSKTIFFLFPTTRLSTENAPCSTR